MSGADRDRKFRSETMISAKLASLIVVFVFSSVVVISLVTDGALFGVAGRAINKFILGVFGHSAYPLFVATIYFAIKLFARGKFSPSRKPVACAAVLFVSAVLCYHLMTSTAMLGEAESYGQYLSACFDAGSGGISTATGGGVVFGLIVYPVKALFDVVGSYIIYCLVFGITVAVMFGGRKKVQPEGVKEYPLEIFGAPQQAAPQYIPQQPQQQAYILPEYSPKASEEPRQPPAPAEQEKEGVVKVPKKLFVGYIEDYVSPKAKKSRQHSRSFDILYSRPRETGYGAAPQEAEARPLGGSSYVDTFGDDLEAKKKYILTPINNMLNPEEDYGKPPAAKKAVEKPPRVDHNMGGMAPKPSRSEGDFNHYAEDDIYERRRTQPKQDFLGDLSALMGRAAAEKPLLSDEESRPTPFERDELKDSMPADHGHDEENFSVRINQPAPFQRKEDPLKFQTHINLERDKPVIKEPYIPPPPSLMNDISFDPNQVAENYEEKVRVLEKTLDEFKVAAKVVSVTPGPTVTRYELKMPPGVPVSRLTSRANDIAMCLASNGEIRIEAPIPGKNLLGIEIPNRKRQKVGLKELIESPEFANNKSPVTFALGKEISGRNVIVDLMKIPHLLVAGSTGSGKSVCLNTLIVSILYKASPDDVRLILIDPKRVEFNVYNGLPHLLLKEVITDAEKAISAFNWAIMEMDRRFELFRDSVARDIVSYNQKMRQSGGQMLPRILIIVDELADLMMINKRELEEKIKKISQLSRAAGIHLILATQRPSVDIITGVIKANLSCRVTFKLMSQADSRTVIDCSGAEKLLGEGDMIFISNNMPKPMRLQGPYISMEEVEAIVDFIKKNNEAQFDDIIEEQIMNSAEGEFDSSEESSDEVDKYFVDAVRLAVEQGQISISMVQRRFAVGYSRAGKIIDEMEKQRLISPFEGSKPRQVLISREEFERRFGKGGQKDF